MPPYAAELETWWSGSGLEALTRLVNDDSDELNPRQCGFAQQLQTRLLTFDNDRAIQTQIQKAWPAIRTARGVDYDANTRKYAKYITSTIFRKPTDGGIDFNRVMDGLGYLDAMEIRRLRLLAATRKAMETGTPSEASAQVVEELDRTATANFRHLHAGFRTCVLIQELNKDAGQRKELPQIMALLNALVPPVVFLEDEDDMDPTPHSPGLRDSVRFSIFEHLMSEDSFSPNRREIIEMKLRCWCDVPGYPRARDALLRYTEEFKKLENVCLKVMNELESRSMATVSYQTISADSSILSGAEASHHSSLLASSLQDESTILTPNTSIDTQQPTTPWVPVAFHPLLKGMPGREISPASTDGAMFARDFSAPPVLSYPDNLSKTEFFQHPFARKLNMSIVEQYDPDTDDEAKEDVPPVPPLPHIPERLKAHLTPNVLNKIKKKMRYQPDKADGLTLDGVPFQSLDQYMGASTTRKSKDKKHRPMLNRNISEANVVTGVGHRHLHSEDSGYEIPSISSSLPESPKWPPRHGQNGRGPGAVLTNPGAEHRPNLKCQLMEPRLSPMEYCRMYLVEKALSERENRQCELPKPEQKWYWTQYHKNFLIVPRIPKDIQRDLVSRPIEPITSPNVVDSDGESVSTLTTEVDYNGLMRLSLHLGNEPVLLPCFTDIPRSNVRESKILEPPDSEGESRDDRDADVPGERDFVLSRRVKGPAGGEVDDWRPMSEYEQDKHDRTLNEDLSFDKLKLLVESEQEPEQGSQTPCKSFGAEVPPEDLHRTDGQSDDCGNLSLSRKLSRVCTKDLSVLDFATPRSKGKTVANTPLSSATMHGRSPLARFPIAVQPTHRLTPGTLTKRVVGESGGQFLSEDTRQARLIPSPSSQLHQGLTADLWDTDTESIISELQPEPLNISRRRPRASTDDDRRWSRMFDGLSSNMPPTLEKFGTHFPVEREGGSKAEADDDDCTFTEGDRTPRGLGYQLQSHTRTTPGSGGLQRSASTIITPTQSKRRLQPKASFSLENTEHSGFTPEHAREDFSKRTFSTSGMMLNLQDTQTRLKYPLREPDEMHLSRSLDDTTPRARRLPDIPKPSQYQPSFTPRDWIRSVTATPRRANIMSRDERPIGSADCTQASFQASSIVDEGEVQLYPSTIMRDFTQSHQLDKQRPRATLTPSSTHRFSKQRFDRSTRASSPPLSGDRSDIAMRRTPSPTELHSTVIPQTPSSAIGGLFRKRVRSEYHPPATPRTPASPRLAWRPFDGDDDEPELPYLSPWASGHAEGKREKEKRAAYFREKVEREIQGRQSPKRSVRRESFSTINRDCTSRNGSVVENRLSKESLVTWTNFIEDAPEPLFSSPLPPVPPLPSESHLNLTLKRLPQNRTPSRAVSGFEPSPAGTFRAKKPQGLKVDTQRLRKANRDGARTPSRSATMTPASASSFRTAFRVEERHMSFGREAEEPQSRERDDEVVSRRM
ncbi:Ff.00g052010.m01.CDS01 [Fusarium sp. VM40]|nr:Ff.00g052010.m01.CDS01 [Fusarium sp. VM40]